MCERKRHTERVFECARERESVTGRKTPEFGRRQSARVRSFLLSPHAGRPSLSGVTLISQSRTVLPYSDM